MLLNWYEKDDFKNQTQTYHFYLIKVNATLYFTSENNQKRVFRKVSIFSLISYSNAKI
jgi:hypothetical protein